MNLKFKQLQIAFDRKLKEVIEESKEEKDKTDDIKRKRQEILGN